METVKERDPDWFAVLGQPTELVGRELELRQLDAVLDRAIQYQAPQLVTILGNEGAGKSRLFVEWTRRTLARHPGVRIFCGRAEPGSAQYGVFTRLLRERFSLVDGEEGPAQRVERFRAEIAEVFGDRRVTEVAHFLGSFLDLDVRESPFLRAVAENQVQHDQIARTVLRRFLEVDAERGPLVLGFEDLQWADARSLSLVHELGSELGGSPVVLVALARPDLLIRDPQWGVSDADHTRIEVGALDPESSARLLRQLAGAARELPSDFVAQAIEVSLGNPFFLEELVRLFLAQGTLLGDGAAWRVQERAFTAELPLTIEAAVRARIAALEPSERDVLEKAATLGNVFWTGAVLVLSRLRHAEAGGDERREAGGDLRERIDALLAELVERDYLLRIPDSTLPGEAEYCFKHNLERELITKLTEPELTRRYHLYAAQWLELRTTERGEEQLEALAKLYERGSDTRRAAELYIAAGDKARARYANDAAIAYYERGSGRCGHDRALARIDALHNLGDVLALVGQTERALARFSEMLRDAWLLDLPAKAGAAHGRIGRLFRQQGELERAVQHFDEAKTLFTQARDERGIAAALDDIGKVKWLRGEYEEALGCCREALGRRRQLGDLRSIALSLSNIGRVHHDSGEFKTALSCFHEALVLRRELDDKPGEIRSLWDLGRVHEALGETDRAIFLYESAYAIARQIGDRLGQAQLLCMLGHARLHAGDARAASDELGQAAELAQSLGDRLLLSECSRSLGETFLLLGDLHAAREQCRQALELAERVRSRAHAGTALRALAKVTAASGMDLVHQDDGRLLYERAISELAEVGNELELSRCYREYADFQERLGQLTMARQLRARADEIGARLRGAASAERSRNPIDLDEPDFDLDVSETG
jgi:tetratricopeptide (TPR) repeat protein